jgi:hypothetical protein
VEEAKFRLAIKVAENNPKRKAEREVEEKRARRRADDDESTPGPSS